MSRTYTEYPVTCGGVVYSEAEASNIASIRVLEKSNFVPNGKVGQEGIRFVWKG